MSAMPWESGVEAELDAVEAPEKYRAALRSFINAVRSEVVLQRKLDATKDALAEAIQHNSVVVAQREEALAQLNEVRAATERYHGFANSSLKRQILEILAQDAGRPNMVGPKGE